MAVVDWDESFSVGHAEIDGDHQRIVGLLNRLCEAYSSGLPDVTVAGLFDGLVAATTEHCQREEALLAARGYPALDAQHAEHRLLLDSLQTLRKRTAAGEPSERVAEVLSDYLLNWFMAHVLEEDMQFREIFRGRQ